MCPLMLGRGPEDPVRDKPWRKLVVTGCGWSLAHRARRDGCARKGPCFWSW